MQVCTRHTEASDGTVVSGIDCDKYPLEREDKAFQP